MLADAVMKVVVSWPGRAVELLRRLRTTVSGSGPGLGLPVTDQYCALLLLEAGAALLLDRRHRPN